MTSYKLVVAGASLGGLSALRIFLSGLSADFPIPIVIVQHRYKDSQVALSQLLGNSTELPVRDIEDKIKIERGVYLAPPDYHVLIEGDHAALSTEGPVSFSRPSIDVLFETAAAAYGAEVIGVVLTGANEDGARGAEAIEQAGGKIIVQDPLQAEAATLPQAAICRTHSACVMPLASISGLLISLCVLQQRDEDHG